MGHFAVVEGMVAVGPHAHDIYSGDEGAWIALTRIVD